MLYIFNPFSNMLNISATFSLLMVFNRVSRREHGDPQIEELNIGEAAEPEGRGTGKTKIRH